MRIGMTNSSRANANQDVVLTDTGKIDPLIFQRRTDRG
jgi:hypothetical protein